MGWEAFLAALTQFGLWLGKKGLEAGAAQMFSVLIDKVLGRKSLEEVYESLLREIPKIVAAVIEQNEITLITAEVKSLEQWLIMNLGGEPEDIKIPIQSASLFGTKIWAKASAFGGGTISTLMLTTHLLFIVYKELERIEPKSLIRHKINAIQLYWKTKRELGEIDFFNKRLGFLVSKTPLNMHERNVIIGYERVPRAGDHKHFIPITRREFNHYFDWEGRRYEFGWKTDRVASHNYAVGRMFHIIAMSNTGQKLKKQVSNAEGCWDAYYRSVLESLKAKTSPIEYQKILTTIEKFKSGDFSIDYRLAENFRPTPFYVSNSNPLKKNIGDTELDLTQREILAFVRGALDNRLDFKLQAKL